MGIMKKVLLIGELNDLARNLNELLSEEFQVQICSWQAENVKSMIKIIQPDLLVICQIGVEEAASDVFDVIRGKFSEIPALGITTKEKWENCKALYDSEQFSVMFRPLTGSKLLKRCHQLLENSDVTELDEEKAEISGKAKTRTKKKIMLVDDSPIVLRRMKSMLERHYDICLASSGEKALELIPKQKPDLILLDYEMDGMDGKTTFEEMKNSEEMKMIPVVFLTSVTDRQSIYAVLKSKPEGYILKPPAEERLMSEIDKILGRE